MRKIELHTRKKKTRTVPIANIFFLRTSIVGTARPFQFNGSKDRRHRTSEDPRRCKLLFAELKRKEREEGEKIVNRVPINLYPCSLK